METVFALKPVRSEGWRERVAEQRSEEIRIAQALDLIGPKLIWLAAERNFDNPDGQLGDETGGDCGAGATSRFVAVKHQRAIEDASGFASTCSLYQQA